MAGYGLFITVNLGAGRHMNMNDSMPLKPQQLRVKINRGMKKCVIADNTDEVALLRSAGLYGTDIATGETGFNLAAILLLGRDEV